MAGYSLRIGSATDYIEFISTGDPMPRFGQGRQNNYNAKGELISTTYTIPLTLYYGGSVSELWTDWTNINTRLDNAVQDIRIYYDGSLKRAYINGGTTASTTVGCVRSPLIRALNPREGKGAWATYIEFDAEIFIQVGCTLTDFSGVVELDRVKEETIENGVKLYTYSIRAKGPGAQTAVVAWKDQLPSNQVVTYEDVAELVDQDTWTGVYKTEKPGAGSMGTVAEVEERISVDGGGRDKDFALVTGENDPVEFDGPRRPTIVTITGRVIATSEAGLMMPDRDDKPGHVLDDSYTISGKGTTTASKYKNFEATYTQVFKLANKDKLADLIEIRSLKDIVSGRHIPLAGFNTPPPQPGINNAIFDVTRKL